MKLTDKCLEDFEKWYDDNQTYELGDVFNGFYARDMNMQCGVYVDFFDSVGINIACYVRAFNISWSAYVSDSFEGKYFETRQETREQAIEKANEIYNNK
tara:strand:- start:20 stop:316 length:297 start_codon:yes stop_codon:yes gene_type:complete